MRYQCFIAVLIVGVACALLQAAEQPNPTDFDTAPKDGRLNQLERARFLIRKLNPPVNDIDTDGDGMPSQEEILEWASDRDPEIGSALRIDPTKTPPTVQQMEVVYPAEPKKEHSYYSLKLRRSHDQIGTPFDDESESLSQAQAALFTYTRDIQNGGDIWSAVGVLARPLNLAEKQIPLFGGAAIDRLDFVPSISFDRNTGGEDVEETDALTFRAQLVSWIQGGLFDLMELSADVRVDTHFGFEEAALVGEADWKPVLLTPISINGGYKFVIPSFLLYRTELLAHLEFGEQLNSEETNEHSENFFRAGPKVGFMLRLNPDFPRPFGRMIAAAN